MSTSTTSPAEQLGWSPVSVRVIIYAPGAGVYLGDGHWSKLNDGGRQAAPTYEKEAAELLVKSFNNNPIDCQIHQVAPDEGIHASRHRLANTLIPWD